MHRLWTQEYAQVSFLVGKKFLGRALYDSTTEYTFFGGVLCVFGGGGGVLERGGNLWKSYEVTKNQKISMSRINKTRSQTQINHIKRCFGPEEIKIGKRSSR